MKMDNQKNANIMIKATVLSAIILFLLCFIVIFCIAFSRDETSEIQENGERYGASDFYKYKDKIYALVIGNGMLEVEGVDIPTFKVFDTEYNSRNVAYDKNKIYFGNIAISDLDTDKLYYVGNNYYSDGTNSYFCSTSVETYEELSALSINIKNISHFLFKTKRPQYYFYPYKKLETNKRLEKVEELRNFATDGKEVYYAGEKLVNADINTIKTIEDALFYFYDKENVYYKSKLLSFKNNGKLKVFHENDYNVYYLYDEESKNVYANDYLFETVNAPYKVVGVDGTHHFSLLFISKNGVYFYDPLISLMKKPLNGQLISRNTRIRYLDKKTAWENDWKKVADINFGRDGSIWKKGNKYYYFDIYGFNQNINRTIYEIVDKGVLDYLLYFSELKDRNIINLPNKIRDFISKKKLIAFNGEVKMTATIHFIEDHYAYSIPKIIFISIFFLFGLYAKYRFDIAKFLKKRKKSKFSKK